MTTPRLLLDISTLLRHWDRADGITRTLSSLAAYALDHVPQIDFIYIGGETPLLVKPHYVRLLLAGKIKIDTSHFKDPDADARLRDRLPAVFMSAILWAQRPRRQFLLLLDNKAPKSQPFASIAGWLRRALLNENYRRTLTAFDGSAVHLVSHEIALSAMKPPRGDDVLIFAGSDWVLMSKTMQRLNSRPRMAVLCYDIIPLLFPEFFAERTVTTFRQCIETVFAPADLVLFSAKQIGNDTRRYWESRRLRLPTTEIVPLGADISTSTDTTGPLPKPLLARKFALFVSTIEPRKNHRLLFDVWKKLLDEGVPQTFDFKLVFVGRKGWMIDDLWKEMVSHSCFDKSLIILNDVDDRTLAALYEGCAFTLYPSFYEGFGLPIVESFRHGKAVIASSAGALLETVAGLSPCLSPSDELSWLTMLKQWIVDPSSYGEFERRIKLDYSPRSWKAAAEQFFQIIRVRLVPAPSLTQSIKASDFKS